jgi:glycosyltransferase involved in cell wall biosynthesis
MKTLGLVVPSLKKGGGVPSLARFVRDTAIASGRFELKTISLSMSSHDQCSLNIAKPSSWLRGVATCEGDWEGLPFTHVGAMFGELEFQRYLSRDQLTDALNGCDVVQVVCGYPAWGNAVSGLGIPVALQAATLVEVERRRRDSVSFGAAGWWRKKMTQVTSGLDNRALRIADVIQVMNPWMLEHARRVNRDRDVDIRLAPPGIDTTSFHPATVRDPDLGPYILCVGRLADPRKNICLLLEAYARLPDLVRRQVGLVLAGACGPPQSFWQRARELGLADSITYIASPLTAELIHLYQNASVFALPSDEEGLGIVLLEAMSCGVPVVSTRSGGPEGIIADGVDGYLVPLDDALTMSARLTELITKPRLNLALGKAARAKIEDKYSARVTGDVFIDIWERLAFANR